MSTPGSGKAPSRRKEVEVTDLSFEQAFAQIESIIDRIETGEVGLEESLGEYERGVTLVAHCRGKLDRAQQQVDDLTKKLETADKSGTAGAGS